MGHPAHRITEPFTATPNAILDHLLRHHLPATQRAVVDWIIRQTFGWHRETVERDLTRIEADTGIDKPGICRALRHLIADGVIIQEGRSLRINPDVGAWGNPDRSEPVVEPTGAEIGNPANNPTAQPLIEIKKKNYPAASSHEGFFQRVKSRFARQNSVAKGVMDMIPEADRPACEGIVARYVKRRGVGYVERAIEYVLFRNPKKFANYLACCLREEWGEQWAAQKAKAAEIDAERQAHAKAKAEEIDAENARIEAINQDFERRREAIFGLPPDELATLERDFIQTLSGFRLKRYKKKGLSAVENDFVEYAESMKKSLDR
jgi:hypothetical protein